MAHLRYFTQIAEEKRALDAAAPAGFVYLISLDNLAKSTKGGSIAQTSTGTGAKFIVEGTHRLMTADEVADFELAETERRS
jgi:hypothetical protein